MGFRKLRGSDIETTLAKQPMMCLTQACRNESFAAAGGHESVEISLTDYPDFTSTPPLTLTDAEESHYVLAGMVEYLDPDTRTVRRFVAGDFYLIEPGTAYAFKAKQGTRLLSIRSQQTRHRISPAVSPALREWLDTPLRVERLDINQQDTRLHPNSLKPAVSVALFNQARALLLIRRRDSGFWAMPGGTMELDDSIESCGVREVFEETGLRIQITGLVGTYSDPDSLIAYSDGEVRREFSVLLHAITELHEVVLDDESTDYIWVFPNTLSEYAVVPAQARRIADALAYRPGRAALLR